LQYQKAVGKEPKVGTKYQSAIPPLIKTNSYLQIQCISERSIWDPTIISNKKCKLHIHSVVEKYLERIRKLWPIGKRYAEDIVLKYLHKCQYNIKMATILADKYSDCDLFIYRI